MGWACVFGCVFSALGEKRKQREPSLSLSLSFLRAPLHATNVHVRARNPIWEGAFCLTSLVHISCPVESYHARLHAMSRGGRGGDSFLTRDLHPCRIALFP